MGGRGLSKIMRDVHGKKCQRCKEPSDEHREVWHVNTQQSGLCADCIASLGEMILRFEKVENGEID